MYILYTSKKSSIHACTIAFLNITCMYTCTVGKICSKKMWIAKLKDEKDPKTSQPKQYYTNTQMSNYENWGSSVLHVLHVYVYNKTQNTILGSMWINVCTVARTFYFMHCTLHGLDSVWQDILTLSQYHAVLLFPASQYCNFINELKFIFVAFKKWLSKTLYYHRNTSVQL